MFITAAVFAATITLTAPENGATYDTHTPCVNEFLSHPAERSVRPPEPPLSEDEIKKRDAQNKKYDAWVAAGKPKASRAKKWERRYNFYERNEWTEALYKKSCEEAKTYKPFQWQADFKGKEMTIEFSETKDFAKSVVEKLPDGAKGKFPWFLKVGTKYYWRVTAKDEGGAKVVSDVREFTTLDNHPRMIGWPSLNCRDMGGGENADGVKVRQGLVFRGQKAHGRSLFDASKLTTMDEFKWFYVEMLGIRTDLDLRGKDESDSAEKQFNCLGFEHFGCQHFYHPIYPYHIGLPDIKVKIAEIFRVMTKIENYPIYFHCAVGSDRTGTIGVLLDGLLGRTDEQIYNNYELPTFNQNLPRLRYCRKAAGMFGELDPKTSKMGGATIRENVVKYLKGIGLTDDELNAIRDIMLEK